MERERPPYWEWPLDRWKLLLALLALLALFFGLRACQAPRVRTVPSFTAPALGATLTQGALGNASGLADPGNIIRIYEGDVLLGETTADANGNWSLALPDLAPGQHTLVPKSYNDKDQLLATGSPLTFTVVAPPLPTPTSTPAPLPAVAPTFNPLPQAPLAGQPFELSGTAAPGALVRVFDGDTPLGEATAGADGVWKLALPGLAAGMHSLVARVIGPDGAVLAESDPFGLDIPALTKPAITFPAPGANLKAGALGELKGTAAPGAIVRIFDGDTVIGEVTADANGNWSFPLPELSAGPHSIRARVFDASGNLLAESDPFAVTIEAAAPVAPAPVVLAPVGGATLIAGEAGTMAGTAAPGAVIRIYDGDTLLGETTADANGNWSFSLPALAAGKHALTARIYTADGALLSTSEPVEVNAVAQTTGLQAPRLTSYLPSTSTNSLPTLTGTAAPGSTVRIYDGVTLLGETIADADGNWYFAPSQPLAPGQHTLRLAAVAADGSEVAGSVVIITVAEDAQAITPPTVTLPANGQIAAGGRIEGLAPAGSRVQFYAGDKLLGEVTADANGRWVFILPTTMETGEYPLRAVILGADGQPLAESAPARVTVVGAPKTLPVTGAAGMK